MHCFRWLIICVCLTACGPNIPVPLQDHSINSASRSVYIVGGGDTLYSVAFLEGLDYKELANWNKISDPYLIRRGQKLVLKAPPGYIKPTEPKRVIEYAKPVLRPSTEQLATQSTASGNVTPENNDASVASNTSKSAIVKQFNEDWVWPVEKTAYQSNNPSALNNGLDILAAKGATIMATESGQVVYAGNGLKGYGNLIIIKHSEDYLSAYANNKDILVQEGDAINQRQVIANLGQTQAGQGQLHFEIRKNGQSLNPLTLLPKNVR